MVIYYCITILANIAALFIFHKYINISVLSVIPVSLIAIMIFQINFFKTEKKKTVSGLHTALIFQITRKINCSLLRPHPLSAQFLG